MFDLENKLIFLSSDVTFVEHVFPFQLTPPSSPSVPFVPLPVTKPPFPPSPILPQPLTNSPPPPLTSLLPPLAPPSHPKRPFTHPTYLQDYVFPTLPSGLSTTSPAPHPSSGTAHSLSSFLSYHRFSNNHFAFLTWILLHILKLCVILIGVMPWLLSSKPWKLTIHGSSHLFLLVRNQLAASGFSKQNFRLMDPLSIIRLASWPMVTLKLKFLTIVTPLLQLQNLLLFAVFLLLLLLKIGLSINWM